MAYIVLRGLSILFGSILSSQEGNWFDEVYVNIATDMRGGGVFSIKGIYLQVKKLDMFI